MLLLNKNKDDSRVQVNFISASNTIKPSLKVLKKDILEFQK